MNGEASQQSRRDRQILGRLRAEPPRPAVANLSAPMDHWLVTTVLDHVPKVSPSVNGSKRFLTLCHSVQGQVPERNGLSFAVPTGWGDGRAL